MRRAVLPAALAVLLAAAPAHASALPPLGLQQGHGTLGLGAFHAAGDVAVLDGVTLGADAYYTLAWNVVSARASWTAWRGEGGGAVGLIATGGRGNGLITPGDVPFLHVGPVFETPDWPVRLRASLAAGCWVRTRATYASGRAYDGGFLHPIAIEPGDVVIGHRTTYDLGIQPNLEIVVPLGRHVELTFLGNGLAGLYGRW